MFSEKQLVEANLYRAELRANQEQHRREELETSYQRLEVEVGVVQRDEVTRLTELLSSAAGGSAGLLLARHRTPEPSHTARKMQQEAQIREDEARRQRGRSSKHREWPQDREKLREESAANEREQRETLRAALEQNKSSNEQPAGTQKENTEPTGQPMSLVIGKATACLKSPK
jgi:hypothetical protein